ncbi:NTP transferase domain-containing protein [Micromonospora sp. WMMD1155]|uniref:NTP transferase domain-containing protein n=1 Tax=Micromonospora sp. WMMD1155 TaxID=3016094 RepID=UPI00249CC6AA|nr:NTP transferase domain-containing protein [Micromonospora sp. WMMD1155]WFE53021.1 NTP transferase domain-containing protein [Micromonospora sp. WMMD1155]
MSGPLSVVVPCAGRGSRLGLPFPKELLPTPDGRVLLDQVVDLIAGLDVRVLLVTAADREPTIAHLHRRYPQVPVAAVRQGADTSGLSAAVRVALPFLGARTVVLLPDQRLQEMPDRSPVADADRLLRATSACFLASWCDDPQRIAADGALTIDRDPSQGGMGRVQRMADKPGLEAAGGHNAVWFAFGFRREVAGPVLDQLDLAERHLLADADFARGPLHAAPVIVVPPFVDCGTWPAVRDMWRRHGKDVPCD